MFQGYVVGWDGKCLHAVSGKEVLEDEESQHVVPQGGVISTNQGAPQTVHNLSEADMGATVSKPERHIRFASSPGWPMQSATEPTFHWTSPERDVWLSDVVFVRRLGSHHRSSSGIVLSLVEEPALRRDCRATRMVRVQLIIAGGGQRLLHRDLYWQCSRQRRQPKHHIP